MTVCEGDSWPTCDNPVVFCDILQGIVHRVPIKAGFWGKHRAILFPISPQKALIGEVHRRIRWKEKTNKTLSDSIKKAICDNAYLYIYSKNKDTDVEIYRKRIVDRDVYMHVKKQFDTWYDNYKLSEGKYLN